MSDELTDSQKGERTDDLKPVVPTDREMVDEPQKVQRAIQKLSQSKPDAIVEMLAIAGSGMSNPLHNKMEAQHITQVLELALKHDEREFELSKTKESNTAAEKISARRYIFWGFLCVVGLLILILLYYKDQPQVLQPLIAGIAGLATGFAGGFGVGKGGSK